MVRAIVAVTFILGLLFGQGVVPPQSQTPPPNAPGFISGTVVDAVTGKPIAEVMVQLSGRPTVPQAPTGVGAGGRGSAPGGRAGLPGPQPVLTDSQGRFFFAGLPAGLYTAQVIKTGFRPVIGAFGPIELAESERLLDWKLRMAKQSSLSGTLRDETGDPAVAVDVSLFRRSVVNGRQLWQLYSRARSDDRGAYRFGDIPAGDFVVCACGRDPVPFDPLLLTTLGSEPVQLMNVAARALSAGADAVSLDNTLRTWAPTFYPNSASLARATRITVAAGDDRNSIDMNLALIRATRVSGRVAGATGPFSASAFRLIPETDAEAGMGLVALTPMLVQPDGRFDFATVPPGQYRLIVVHRPNLASGGPSGAAMGFAGARGITQPPSGATMANVGLAPADPALWANEPITVGENGLSGLTVTLNRSLSVSGRLELIGGAPQPQPQLFNRLIVSMEPLDRSDSTSASTFETGRFFSPDGRFSMPGVVPGKYALNITQVPGFPTLKSVMIGGMDLTDMPLVVGDKDVADIVVTYTDTPMASLTVMLNAAPGTKGDDGSLLVFPVDRKYWTESAAAGRRFRQIRMPVKNIATTPELPAGDYFVVYASALEAADWMEAGKLDLLSRGAKRVTVGDTGKATVEVRR